MFDDQSLHRNSFDGKIKEYDSEFPESTEQSLKKMCK